MVWGGGSQCFIQRPIQFLHDPFIRLGKLNGPSKVMSKILMAYSKTQWQKYLSTAAILLGWKGHIITISTILKCPTIPLVLLDV